MTYFYRSARFAFISLSVLTFAHKAYSQAQPDMNVMMQRMQAAQAAMSGVTAATPAAPATYASQPLGEKKPGVVRLGVFMPQYEMGGPGGPSAGESIRTIEEQFLSGPKLEVVRMSALLPVQALAEAKEKNCDYVLVSSLNQKKSGSSFGALKGLSVVAPMAYMVPGAGMAGVAVSQGLSIASTAAVLASNGVKAKAEVTFDYSLNSLDGTSVLKNTQKVKAKTDGEDVVTPMIQKAATEMVTALNK